MEFKKGTIINNKYEILGLIGKGASAKVFLSKDLESNMRVALKIQNVEEEFSNMDKRFKIEAKTMLSLNHKNIVKTYDYFEWNGRRIIVMEYLRGKTVENMIRDNGHLSNKESANYILQILYALREMHKREIMHRDLKPANIIITLDNTVKLMDFGIVQISKNQELTKQASVIGTIQYLAPEIFKGTKATPTSEIFSLGVLLYKMVTGVVPFRGSNPEETAKKILYDKPLPPSRVNPDVDFKLELIIMKMIEKDPYNRIFDTNLAIEEFLDYLDKKDESKSNEDSSDKKKSKKWFFWS